MIAVTIDEFTPCLKNTPMNTMELKKKYDDSSVDSYLEKHDVYNSSDLCINIAEVIRYAREHGISLSDVPQEIVDQYSVISSQMVG